MTGAIALGHYAFGGSGNLPLNWDLIVGIVLVVVGLPLLAIAAVRMSHREGMLGAGRNPAAPAAGAELRSAE